MPVEKGGFTLPGEAGFEQLTLDLATRWGADAIRDSDGTTISPEILAAGYDIYSTICIIRGHNDWIRKNLHTRQQTFLMSKPIMAEGQTVVIDLLDGYFRDQFEINTGAESMHHWQVFNRTTGQEVSPSDWSYHNGQVVLEHARPFDRYTVNFLAYRIWEEISMYNHVTNHWDQEHLLQLDPRYPEAREYLKHWLHMWCQAHSETDIVRFTSLFYNFVWIWSGEPGLSHVFSDWGSYDFTVSDKALADFSLAFGYEMKSEDFINQGKFHSTHQPATSRKKDWMAFTQAFVAEFGRELVEIVHSYGKKAYVFYDDSWIGLEPYGKHFASIGFDGLIKCVFSGYEARLCAGCQTVPVHELRLHPYLFPTGLGGQPTFAQGGQPGIDARKYWVNVRRALLREPVERIGLGGYLHLVEDHPDFLAAVDEIVQEFQMIKACHAAGKPSALPLKIGVLHSWGSLRPWTLSGHFHESSDHPLIHINESLSGLPFDVCFLDFDDLRAGRAQDVDVLINAGRAGDAWSGGNNWDAAAVNAVTAWVWQGGILIGIGEPGAVAGGDANFCLAHILGIDNDCGEFASHGRRSFVTERSTGDFIPGELPGVRNLYLTRSDVKVHAAFDGVPVMTESKFGQGRGIYLSDFKYSPANTRKLLNLLIYASGCPNDQPMASETSAECTYYPQSNKIIITNCSSDKIDIHINFLKKDIVANIAPFGMVTVDT